MKRRMRGKVSERVNGEGKVNERIEGKVKGRMRGRCR